MPIETKTTYQRLSDYWKDTENGANSSYRGIEDEVILKTSSEEEYRLKKLEGQQTEYLKDQWHKGSRQLIQNKLISEGLRIPSYRDYDLMAADEIIGRALEIYTEETLVLNEKGSFLNIYSESSKVQNELNNLFFNVLNSHSNIPLWTYELIKKGDCFLHLNLQDVKGVVGVRILPTAEIDRIENSYIDTLQGTFNPLNPNETYFRWSTSGLVNFKYWSIAHFRLMLDQTRLPYGISILEKCRRVWRNLLMAEDAMLSTHMVRGVDRLIHQVEVGNLDPSDVDAYMQELADRFKRKVKTDPKTGQIDHQYNVMGIDQDYFIPMRGGIGSKIDKLEGQSNLDTSVVDHFMKKLMAALGIPLTYLSYSETAGEGKSLAMQDIRFAKTVMRIQQSLLQELNKIAVTHLILIGMEDEVGNFNLSMNNPSLQSEILRLEVLSQKVDLYNSAIDNSAGIAAFSVTKAKQEILNMSNDDITNELQKIRIETAVKMELDNTDQIIPTSGIFKATDAIYGSEPENFSDESDDIDDMSLSGGNSGSSDLSSSDSIDIENIDDTESENEDQSEEDEDVDISDYNLEERVHLLKEKINNILKG